MRSFCYLIYFLEWLCLSTASLNMTTSERLVTYLESSRSLLCFSYVSALGCAAAVIISAFCISCPLTVVLISSAQFSVFRPLKGFSYSDEWMAFDPTLSLLKKRNTLNSLFTGITLWTFKIFTQSWLERNVVQLWVRSAMCVFSSLLLTSDNSIPYFTFFGAFLITHYSPRAIWLLLV